ncbi:MAG: GSCFA family protein [Candidatus Nitrotoga sp. LAW]|nr:MAG: GSCFA family protein [Candidatus Nitrotoga sp. LAW]
MASEIGSIAAQRKGSGAASWAENSWHQSVAHAYPTRFEELGDLSRLITDHVVRGHTPDKPPLARGDNVVTLGSCFAAELRYFLNEAGLASDSFWVPSGLNNTYALLDFISWCATGKQTEKGFRYERTPDGTLKDWTPTHEREEYLDKLRTAGAIVFTIGLAEVWEDSHTGQVFWRGIPELIFDEGRHRFRITTVDENRKNIRQIIDLIRKINGTVPIVLTLSPVPLKATFQNVSCMTADCVSKSILRVAIAEIMQENRPDIFYWPSFEIVKWGGCHLPYPVYGTDDAVVRHVSRYVVMHILFEFVRYFYGENTLTQVKATFDTNIQKDPGGPGQPPILIRGTIVDA